VTRYLSGNPLRVNRLMIGVNKEGFPSSLEFFKEFIDSKEPDKIRFVLTCLNVSRAMKYNSPPDYSSITKEFSGSIETLPQEFIDIFVNDFVKELPPVHPEPVKSFFLTLKSGPLNGPALLHSLQSIKSFTGSNLFGLSVLAGPEAMD